MTGLAALLAIVAATAPRPHAPVHLSSVGGASESSKLPLSFVANRGQADSKVRYYARGDGFAFYFFDRRATLAFARGDRGTALSLRFVGVSPSARLEGVQPRAGRENYLKGADPAAWITDVPTFSELRYRNLWPGIDLVLRGRGGSLKYEFVVGPGADPSRIRLVYSGAASLALDGGGLLVRTRLGALRDAPPKSHQVIGGKKAAVQSRYRIGRPGAYGFAVGTYDRARPLVIDPSLYYSTFLGDSGADENARIAVDADGSAYVTGRTISSDFPTTAGAFDPTNNADDASAFVTKLDESGSSLIYSTYLGGSSFDEGLGISIDSAGSAYVAGRTQSTDFPTTAGALDRTKDGLLDAFVTKLDPSGSSLVYSTYLGATGDFDEVDGLAVDSNGSAYVTGFTDGDFPTTPGAFDRTFNGFNDVFAAKLDSTGSALDYSTYLGGDANDFAKAIAVDAAGSAYVAGTTDSAHFPTTPRAFDTKFDGSDGFVAKLDSAGSALDYGTFLAGAYPAAIALDGGGSAYVAGATDGSSFPTTIGAFDTTSNGGLDAFITKLDPDASALTYSTYLGGSYSDEAWGIGVGGGGTAYVTGETNSTNFPVTPGAIDQVANGNDDAFVTALSPGGSSLDHSTYLGGSGYDTAFGIGLDRADHPYVAGDTTSSNFPTTPGAFDTTYGAADAFVTRLELQPYYVHPKGATPIRASLVPAYAACSSANSIHGSPLAYASCAPPQPASAQLTLGTPDANGSGANSVGAVGVAAIPGNPSTPADEGDVRFTVSLTDVRNASDLADYAGELLSSQTIRLTDRLSLHPPDPATVEDFPFALAVPCTPTADATIGSSCAIATTADALAPGTVRESARTIWQLGQIQLFDGGSDGVASTEPNTLFAVQGVFVP